MDEKDKFEEFFSQFYSKQLTAAAAAGESSITVDFYDLDRFDPDLSDSLLQEPEKMISLSKEAISEIEAAEGKDIIPRFRNLPSQQAIRIRNLRSEHIGKFISLDGVVRRASEVKPEVSVAIFKCPDCGELIKTEPEDRLIKPPYACNCGKKGTGFTLVKTKLFDSRWLSIEEPFDIITTEKRGDVNIYLRDSLTTPEMQRKCDPGSRLTVNGILKEIKKTSKGRVKTQMDIYLDVNYVEPTEIEWEEVEITEEDEEKIKQLAHNPEVYEKVSSSLAPSIFGLKEIKQAIMYQLFGGVQHILPDKTRIRGDIHVLLLGDPSTAKSQILKLVAGVIPRGKYVSGKGTSSAGLTATVVKDEEMGGWVLEAGAMVLANKGVLCVDEFDKMDSADQVAMHEGLEQQTVSIAKASIIATLPAQVAVLAGANPTHLRFDPYRPIAEQTKIPETLLSRFDLKFALRDVPDRERDEQIAGHILETRLNPDIVIPEIEPEFLRKYIAYVRKNCHPKITKEAIEKLKKFYIEMRTEYSGENTIAITLRQNEALMRIAEASAKIRMSDIVNEEDAQRAINIMEYSIRQLGYDAETGKIDIDRTEGTSSSQRSKIHRILDIIDSLEKELGKQIPKEDIIAQAEDQGIKANDIEEVLNRLKREGTVFEPRQNFVQKV